MEERNIERILESIRESNNITFQDTVGYDDVVVEVCSFLPIIPELFDMKFGTGDSEIKVYDSAWQDITDEVSLDYSDEFERLKQDAHDYVDAFIEKGGCKND